MINKTTLLASLLSGAALCTTHATLLAYYPLNGDFNDASGNGNDGVFMGGTNYSDDTPAVLNGGKSVAFDGLPGTYGVIQPDADGLAITALPIFSGSMWVKGLGTANSDDRIFSEGLSANNNPLFNIGTHNSSANGALDIYIRNGSGAETLGHEYTTAEPFDGTWHHVAWVNNGKLLDVFIDGVFDRQFDYSRVPDFTPTNTTIGGILRASDCCNFLGSIDEFALWDNALTAAEITQLAAGASPLSLGNTSPFEITAIIRDSDGNITFTWNSIPDTTYGVWTSLDLKEPWIELDDSFLSEGDQTTFTLETGNPALDPAIEPRIFFRVTR